MGPPGAVWYSITADDRDLDRFVAGLTAALAVAVPGMDDSVIDIGSSRSSDDDAMRAAALASMADSRSPNTRHDTPRWNGGKAPLVGGSPILMRGSSSAADRRRIRHVVSHGRQSALLLRGPSAGPAADRRWEPELIVEDLSASGDAYVADDKVLVGNDPYELVVAPAEGAPHVLVTGVHRLVRGHDSTLGGPMTGIAWTTLAGREARPPVPFIAAYRGESPVREVSPMSNAATRPPKHPPPWFVHTAWRVHRALYRLSGGRFLWTTSNKRGWGALRLTTIGRKSGQERSVIIGYLEDGPNLVAIAMNGWDEGHPAWWLNLEAHPDAVVRLPHQQPRLVRARPSAGEERDRLWQRWVAVDPRLDAYAVRRSTETPVIVLEPRSRTA